MIRTSPVKVEHRDILTVNDVLVWKQLDRGKRQRVKVLNNRPERIFYNLSRCSVPISKIIYVVPILAFLKLLNKVKHREFTLTHNNGINGAALLGQDLRK